jgi:hypothetical protein
MPSLKTYLHGIAPFIGLSPGALYERQRSLAKLGLLTAAPGRGPGSGVLLTAENAAAVVISALASDSLSEVDQRVVALCGALPEADVISYMRGVTGPTFRSEVAGILSGQPTQLKPAPRHYRGIRVSRCWRGQIMHGMGAAMRSIDFFVDKHHRHVSIRQISVTAEIEEQMLGNLVAYTKDALSQTTELEEEG